LKVELKLIEKAIKKEKSDKKHEIKKQKISFGFDLPSKVQKEISDFAHNV
jgi:hypothetical protein